ncbi:glutamate-5-semialdehyde dehydrogenase [Flavisolibacter ginsenosidimutans]|uniref:Gamma-glutamyl phosphate reductase n=1 Tax=Flavisolibacter ginsenosidimutans TaxID=661481 RepID=A0A5B8UHR1_9BACT|nr:glutamate-5-semialdehyde dehydrogenase [Flavisolibacter ginsenosidimutans]QEC56184.1 glutamate-5-semialdehyde dehydrogenase [Flavisolibacter ginsenosidimutans]
MTTNVDKIIRDTHKASRALQLASEETVQTALEKMASHVEEGTANLIKANRKDVQRLGANDPMADRLLLNEARIKNIAAAIRSVAGLPSPVDQLLVKRKLKNGLLLQKRTAPFGVVGMIYESRPNVTFDTAALCLRSKNACLLKGSKHAEETNIAAVKIIHRALKEAGLSPQCVGLLPSDRSSLQHLFTATAYVDVIIPRGSQSLIETVRKNSLVPVIETGAGVCHVYVHEEADLTKALRIVENAKVSRPSVCNSMDTLLLDKKIAAPFLSALAAEFEKHGVQIFADATAHRLLKGYPFLHKATAESFGTEFLSLKCSVKTVNGLNEALDHIQAYSTKHSEAIVSENKAVCKTFLQAVDAAVVYENASTRFTDGEEFGLGAEIGISTQKLHARGPFALEKLVTEKWVVSGQGQIR